MTAAAPQSWNETDIPSVPAADLAAAVSLWLARERQGVFLVGQAPVATTTTIETAVIGLFDHPARGLGVLLRMRALTDALAGRRFRHLLRAEHAAELARLIAIAAGIRLNPRWGMSPLRLTWALSATSEESSLVREAA
jgi:hypothetical protein